MTGVVRNKVIFCEGNLDLDVLNKVIENQSNSVTIVASGSKFSFSVFIQAYFKNKNDENDEKQNNEENQKNTNKYLIFRDRDFDIEPTAEIKLLQIDKLGNRAFLSHRTCIENYLLYPELIHQYWITKYAEHSENPTISKWGHGNSPGVDKITQWIEEAAKILRDYQAVRWALGNLCQLSASRQQLKTTWTKKIPDSLSLSECKSRALSLINDFQNTVAEVKKDKFEESLDRYLQLFHQQEFWQEKQYLIWFNGKDIYKALHKISQDKTRPYKSYISMDKFSKWAVNYIDINQYPDLIELKNKIEQL
ncbi:MAG: hypothetical protein EAZ76_15285 [Nostocales cyanobacterium]|nr:MAG: hypothetical protein EAZ87_01790 [Nostocales cyanobacterium]TAF11083.1 MAG: hypothetical protein EAZ76_15285 [Nostocales cyanobacterium]